MVEEKLGISGWDLRKALRRFLKSNPALHEWLVSPIVYRNDTGLADSLRRLAKQNYSLRAVGASCLNWARQHEARHLRDRNEVSLKKYLYVIRPLTAISWLERHGTLPPMNLRVILAGIRLSSTVEAAIDIQIGRAHV